MLKSRLTRYPLQVGLATLFLFCQLLAIRLCIPKILGLSITHSREVGLAIGILFDAVSALLVLGLAVLFSSLSRQLLWIVWGLGAMIFGLSTSFNYLFLDFFKTPLSLVVILNNTRDAVAAGPSLIHELLKPPLWLSALVLGIGGMLVYQARRTVPIRRLGRAAAGGLLIAVALVAKQVPAWQRIPYHMDSPVAQSPIMNWWLQATSADAIILGDLPKPLEDAKAQELRSQLQHLLSLQQTGRKAAELTASVLRERLSLPAQGNVHVLYIFLESLRYFEMAEPDLSREVLPNTLRRISEHGILFTNAYSSGLTTNDGQFSALCSALPNMRGGNVYHSHKALRISCLPELLSKKNYLTHLYVGQQVNYGSMDLFNLTHGTQFAYGSEYFGSLGLPGRPGRWGISDAAILKHSLEQVADAEKLGRPLYATVMTLNTHHPFTYLEDSALSPDIDRATQVNANFRGYLSGVKAQDRVISEFIDSAFNSPWGDRILLAFVGDQVTNIDIHRPVPFWQRVEIAHRVPLFLMTKNTRPARIDYPVHQMDIPATIAAIVDADANHQLQGRNILAGSGTPFVFESQTGSQLYYRLANTSCYTAPGASKLSCFEWDGKHDLMFAENPRPLPENSATTALFRKAVSANTLLIQANRLEF